MPPSGRLSAQIRPPCASTRPRAIASPRPAPPLVRAPSSRQKRSNIRLAVSGVSPSPVSSTTIRTSSVSDWAWTATAPSLGVCRTAFASRL